MSSLVQISPSDRATENLIFGRPATKNFAASGNYIMRGLKHARALDIYHLILAPTHACNLRCKHCYLPDHAADMLPEGRVLTLVEEWSDIVSRERGAYGGIFHVKGGEPFVVPYLAKIADLLVRTKTLRFMLTTNGTHDRTPVYDLLDRAHQGLDGHLTVVVSLDGATSETHDFLRGPGQFRRTMGFVHMLSRLNIQTFLNCVLHSGNIHEVIDFISLAKEARVAQINFLPLVPKGYGSDLRTHQIPHLEVHNIIEKAYWSGDEGTRALLAGSLPDILDNERRGRASTSAECVAGYRGLLYIKPDGAAYTCPNLEDSMFSIGNVHNTSLAGLMDLLAPFHTSLRSDGVVDRYVCTGERKRYEADGDVANLTSLANLADGASHPDVPNTRADSTHVAYCVSRNW